MGKIVKITTPSGAVVTVSMTKWSALKRGVVSALPGPKPTCFSPRYETTVFNGPNALSLSPYCKFFYADEGTALAEWTSLTQCIEQYGLGGVEFFVAPLNPKNEKVRYLRG